jgi:hypothetical protein
MFVGVPDEMLRTIGLIVVLGAQLDLARMKLHGLVRSIPVTKSAATYRDKVTKEIRQAFGLAPLSPMNDRIAAWLDEAEALFRLRPPEVGRRPCCAPTVST